MFYLKWNANSFKLKGNGRALQTDWEERSCSKALSWSCMSNPKHITTASSQASTPTGIRVIVSAQIFKYLQQKYVLHRSFRQLEHWPALLLLFTLPVDQYLLCLLQWPVLIIQACRCRSFPLDSMGEWASIDPLFLFTVSSYSLSIQLHQSISASDTPHLK